MKRTTYILIGVLVTALVLMIALIGYTAFAESNMKRERAGITFPDEQKEMDMTGIRTVKFFITQSGVPKHVSVLGDLFVTSSDTIGKPTIAYPETEFLNIARQGDTLLVNFNLKETILPQNLKDKEWIPLYNVRLNLKIDSTLTYIQNDAQQLDMSIKSLKHDSLAIAAVHSRLSVDSCNIRALNLSGGELAFRATNSTIRDFYLDLDTAWDWQFENCIIGTEFLTGSGKHRNNLQRGECKRVVWTPKEEGAELEVTLCEKATVLVSGE